jgi:hypothetical protein
VVILNILETDIINMLKFLIDNIFAMFGGRVFQQKFGIPMGTNFSPTSVLNRPALSISRYRSRYEADICICGILYFKLNGIDVIKQITKLRIM